MIKTNLVPLYFTTINEREEQEFKDQLVVLKEMYADEANFLDPIPIGDDLPKNADAVVFPQLIGEVFKEREKVFNIDIPIIVLTSKYGTVEMWDWEIVTWLREEGDLNVFSPYNIELAKAILRAITVKKEMLDGAKFLMFQDSPGEGMQANIFKRFYWWEEECTKQIEKAYGVQIIYRSWKELNENARKVSDDVAREASKDWDAPTEGLSEDAYLKAVKIYVAVKEVIDSIGDIKAVGANCLNESFNSDTTPCLAWNMLFEHDDILWACEGDTVTLISKYILYSIIRAPIMMTNIYPFLVGMAALAHEKITEFPDIEDSDNHALGVHCGYFGLAPKSFCSSYTVRPKVLEIVSDDAHMIDCRFPEGPITMAKLHSDMKTLTIIEAEIVDYVQYPGSDCRNGALIKYRNNNGHEVMETLSSHHQLIISGDFSHVILQVAKVFGFYVKII